jgi:fibronectin-binding autotransporter adhesin
MKPAILPRRASFQTSYRLAARAAFRALLIGVCTSAAGSAIAQQTYYWDTNPNTATAGNGVREGGAGTWDNATANFTTSVTDAAGVNHNVWSSALNGAGKDTVVFGGAAGGAILLNNFASGGQIGTSTTAAVNNLTFETSGYAISGSNALRFVNNGAVGGSITVAPGVTASIANGIQGTTSGALTSTTTGADGAVDTFVDIGGGGTLTMSGGNGSMGFNIGNGIVGTTVIQTAGGFSGWNLNTINANSVLRVGATANVIQAPSWFNGAGTIDLNGTLQSMSTVGGALQITNSTSTGSATLNLTVTNGATFNGTVVHTGVISNGTGKLSLSTTSTLAQGTGFGSPNAFASQTFAGANTYSGSTSHGRGTMILNFSNNAAPTSNILYSAGFVGNNAAASDGTLVFTRPIGSGFTDGAGTLATLSIIGEAGTANSQTFNGLTLNANSAGQIFLNPASGGSLQLGLGSTITRNSGGVVNFATGASHNANSTAVGVINTNTLTFSTDNAANYTVGMNFSGANVPAGTTVTAINYATGVLTLSNNLNGAPGAGSTFTGTIGGVTTALAPSASITTSAGTASSVLKSASGVAFATLAGRDWAAKNAANTAVVAATYTNSTPSSFAANADITLVGGAANDTRLTSDTTISTLRYSSVERAGVSLGSSTLTTGGILSSIVSDTSAGSFLTGGVVKSAGSDLTLIQYAGTNDRWFGLNSSVADQAAGTGFTKSGTGIAILNGDNTYTGALNVQQGGLILRGANAPSSIFVNGSQTNIMGAQLPGNSAAGGAFLQLGNSDTAGSLGSSEIQLGVNAVLAIKRTDSVTINNNIRGNGGLTQGGSGTTTLLSATTAGGSRYTYAGDTTVNSGTLRLDYSAGDFGILSDSSRLVLGGGALDYAGAAGTANIDAVRDVVLNSGASTITKTGGAAAGRLRLNSLTTQNVGGTLNFTAANIADVDTTNSNGILGATARYTVGNADWAVNSTNAGDGLVTAFSAYVAPGLAAGTDTSNSLVTTAGTTTFTGSRTTNSLKLDTGLGAQTISLGATTLSLSSGGLLVTGNNAATITGGTFRSTQANSDLVIHQHNTSATGLTINSVISNGNGTNNLTKSGDGLLTLGGTNTFTGQTFLNGGITSISSNANLGAVATGATLNMNNGTLRATTTIGLWNNNAGTNNRNVVLNGVGGTFDVTGQFETLSIAGTISGPGGLTKTGLGFLEIRQATYTGPTNVNGGTLSFGAEVNPLYSALNVGTSGTVNLNGFNNMVGSLSGSGTVSNSGAIATLSVGALHSDSSFAGKLTNEANGLSLEKIGGGTLTLTGSANDYTGTTTISGGTLALTGTGAVPASTQLTISSATGRFDVSGISGTTSTIASLSGVSGSSVTLGGKNLMMSSGISNDEFTYAGTISGTGGLSKEGPSVQIFTGASTFSGPTVITAGTILANNLSGSALGTSNVTVDAISSIDPLLEPVTFGGTGSISGVVTLANGGTLAPGASVGILGVGGANGTGNLNIEFNSSLGIFDRLNVAGALNLDNFSLNFTDLAVVPGTLTSQNYVFATYDSLSGTTNAFSSIVGTPNGYLVNYAFNGKNVALVAVPEPSSIALLVVAGLGGAWYRRNRYLKSDNSKA